MVRRSAHRKGHVRGQIFRRAVERARSIRFRHCLHFHARTGHCDVRACVETLFIYCYHASGKGVATQRETLRGTTRLPKRRSRHPCEARCRKPRIMASRLLRRAPSHGRTAPALPTSPGAAHRIARGLPKTRPDILELHHPAIPATELQRPSRGTFEHATWTRELPRQDPHRERSPDSYSKFRTVCIQNRPEYRRDSIPPRGNGSGRQPWQMDILLGEPHASPRQDRGERKSHAQHLRSVGSRRKWRARRERNPDWSAGFDGGR
mmetsp:Transcript_10583/g.23101  ORF Transcript_10583/g.23101 Transcript_10583/m.23101 type:complete len:264 (+) Transcript_10583:235-1026(+)